MMGIMIRRPDMSGVLTSLAQPFRGPIRCNKRTQTCIPDCVGRATPLMDRAGQVLTVGLHFRGLVVTHLRGRY